MFSRRRNDVPLLNTTSTADISFMLLVFFLVTSSMDTDKGLPRQLPPPDETTELQEHEVKRRNVMELAIDATDRLTCNGEAVSTDELSRRVEEFVANENGDPQLPEMSRREVHLLGLCAVSDRHVITVEADRRSTYNAYFEMQNAIVRGYARLRDRLARQRFRRSYAQCSQEQRDAIAIVYPQRISEWAAPADDAYQAKEGAQ